MLKFNRELNQLIEDPIQKNESVRMIHESDIAHQFPSFSEDRTNNCPRWGGFVC